MLLFSNIFDGLFNKFSCSNFSVNSWLYFWLLSLTCPFISLTCLIFCSLRAYKNFRHLRVPFEVFESELEVCFSLDDFCLKPSILTLNQIGLISHCLYLSVYSLCTLVRIEFLPFRFIELFLCIRCIFQCNLVFLMIPFVSFRILFISLSCVLAKACLELLFTSFLICTP
ncbi:unnamed protein product [Moneuplotes crassus]|uniref:Uncharacterized protein n=1 Tax=Euplotes crassus TaxID=5936 RepID=A0AAD2D6W3_EUPCR|nr:unnamed protein product [Moneuplotes crassus]